jgi:hypothetical protein
MEITGNETRELSPGINVLKLKWKSKNNTHYKTRQGKFNRGIKIQTNQLNKRGGKRFKNY